jgi:hypothetical protein
MGSAWPELEELIRELGDVCALSDAEGEPSLSEATMAVTKATTALTHAAQRRGRAAEVSLAKALEAVGEARAILQRARVTISASASRRRSASRSAAAARAAAETAETPDGRLESSCAACGIPFVVRYRASADGPTVAFPVGCPAPRCDGVTSVEYPSSALDVVVERLAD